MANYSLGNVIRAGAWGVLVGGTAGFALGMLLAPEEGQKIRRRVAYQLEHLSRQLGSFIDQLTSGDGAESEARKEADEVVADARERAQRIRRDIDSLMDEMREGDASRSAATG